MGVSSGPLEGLFEPWGASEAEGSSGPPFGHPLGAVLGASWAVLEASRGPPGSFPEASWGLLFPLWGRYWACPGAVLGASWAVFGPYWAVLGRYWAVLGPSWGPVGPSWGDLGGLLGSLGRCEAPKVGRCEPPKVVDAKNIRFLKRNGKMFASWGLLGGPLEALLGLLGGFYGRLEAIVTDWGRSFGDSRPSWTVSGTFRSPVGALLGRSGGVDRGSPGTQPGYFSSGDPQEPPRAREVEKSLTSYRRS